MGHSPCRVYEPKPTTHARFNITAQLEQSHAFGFRQQSDARLHQATRNASDSWRGGKGARGNSKCEPRLGGTTAQKSV